MSDMHQEPLPKDLDAEYESLLAFWALEEWHWIAKHRETGGNVLVFSIHGRTEVLPVKEGRELIKSLLADYEEAIALTKLALDKLK